MKPSWFPDWSGEQVVIIGSGPSAQEQPIHLIKGRARVIAINNSWRLAPWADALYACDQAWWQTGAGDEFDGLKISRSEHPGVQKVELARDDSGAWLNEMVFHRPGIIGAGAGSGFQALNLAVQFGARRIALVGLDCRVDQGLHWHGAHGGQLSNPTCVTAALWTKYLDDAAPALEARGVEVVNCSPVSALTAYRHAELADVLARELA